MEEQKQEELLENKETEEKTEEKGLTDAQLGLVEAKEGELNEGFSFPWFAVIVFGVLVLFFVICVIVVFANGGPIVD